MTLVLDDTKTLRSRNHEIVGHLTVHVGIALVLLFAASLKAYQLLTEPVIARGLIRSRPFLIGIVEVELIIGIWLLSRLWQRTARLVAGACFAVFAAMNVWMICTGQTSCGCFGKVEIDPRLTLALDIAVLIAMTVFFPIPSTHQSLRSHRIRSGIGMTVVFAVGLPFAVLASRERSAAVAEVDIDVSGSLVVLEPEKWIGKPLPLIKYIDIGKQLTRGKWKLLLYHHDCPACLAAISKYEKEIHTPQSQTNVARGALVEVPPYGDQPTNVEGAVHGQLDSAHEWFVQTPVWLSISDSIVTGMD